MESTFKGNHEIMVYLNLIGLTMYAEYNSSKNMEGTFNGKHNTILYSS